jgi:hypothetical protein
MPQVSVSTAQPYHYLHEPKLLSCEMACNNPPILVLEQTPIVSSSPPAPGKNLWFFCDPAARVFCHRSRALLDFMFTCPPPTPYHAMKRVFIERPVAADFLCLREYLVTVASSHCMSKGLWDQISLDMRPSLF